MKGLSAWGWWLAIATLVVTSGSGVRTWGPASAGPSMVRLKPDPTEAVKKQFAGEWTLVKYEIIGENGQTRPGNYDIGRINYGDREMSAHLMRSGRSKDTPTTEAARAAAYQGYLGYFGPYTIDAEKKIVVHHVVGSSLPNWIGSEQVRHYEFSSDGAQLTLSLKNGDRITQTLTWERTAR